MLRLSVAYLVLLTSTIARAQTAPQAKSEPNEQFGGAFDRGYKPVERDYQCNAKISEKRI